MARYGHRGHIDRGTGILNNEAYRGRLIFNRRKLRKNPKTEKREARMNGENSWVIVGSLMMRSGTRVKQRQMAVHEQAEPDTPAKLSAQRHSALRPLRRPLCDFGQGPLQLHEPWQEAAARPP